jgi:hypothetical protein
MPLDFAGQAKPLVPGDIEAVAEDLGWEPAMVRAVMEVEAAGGGFLSDGRPKILFEAHVFYRETGGRFGPSNISSPNWNRSLYGAAGAHQYMRLEQAIARNREAALRSASWGGFQIMGFNHALCGFADVESFVRAMMTSERAQLDAFAAFCRSQNLARHLRGATPNFAAFARGYNGPAYAKNAYDTKMETAWQKWRAAEQNLAVEARREQLGDIVTDVRRLQERLTKAGFNPGPADGANGKRTSDAAINAWREWRRLT